MAFVSEPPFRDKPINSQTPGAGFWTKHKLHSIRKQIEPRVIGFYLQVSLNNGDFFKRIESMCFLVRPFWMKRNLIVIILQHVLVFKIFYYSHRQNFSLTSEYDQITLKEYIDPFTGEPVKKNK